MRSIAIMNQKGGVGKTTTAVNVSAALAAAGAKVCLIDLDHQSNATAHLGLEQEGKYDSIYDVLVGKRPLQAARKQVSENLWLVPSHGDMSSAELQLAGVVGREMILRDRLAADDMKFDFVLIDCPPSLGIVTLNALTAADEVIVPVQAQFFGIQGLVNLIDTIEMVAERVNNRLILRGVVLCIYDGQTRLAMEATEEIGAFFGSGQKRHTAWSNAQLFQTKIRRNIKLAEAPGHGQSIFDYDAGSNGAEDYRRLAEEIMQQTRSTG